ncbi:MAG: RNase adapter RapZ [Oscillospiraceae bacterium]|nr:RNase adapter RapZ [Oscillospiraceae bacterium]
MELLIITGISGSGKSMVANIIEDMGYYAVDNMPAELFPAFAELCLAAKGLYNRYEKVALVTDVRAGSDFSALFASLDMLKSMNCEYKIVFIESDFDTILRRYKETRRRHPIAEEGELLPDTLQREKELLLPLREKSDFIIDTGTLSSNAIRNHIAEILPGIRSRPMVITVLSFGFKYGLPMESDLVFDVRFLPNPYHVIDLRNLSGLDEPVRDFLHKMPQTKEFLQKLKDMLAYLLPQYIEEGKTELVVAIGCTGGRHRSVAISRALFGYLMELGYCVALAHRDIYKDPVSDN